MQVISLISAICMVHASSHLGFSVSPNEEGLSYFHICLQKVDEAIAVAYGPAPYDQFNSLLSCSELTKQTYEAVIQYNRTFFILSTGLILVVLGIGSRVVVTKKKEKVVLCFIACMLIAASWLFKTNNSREERFEESYLQRLLIEKDFLIQEN
jgi:hypothetical protein